MTVDGLLSSELSLPVESSPDINRLSEQLRHPNNIYTLQTDRECEAPSSTVQLADDLITAVYESRCGLDNKIGQLDILLFDTLPGLEEVEVTVTTPATKKHFAINRRCESAIFRLD